MQTHNYTVMVNLTKYGAVTADVTYCMGYSGSYWEPPDSDEVIVNKVTDANGVEIHLSDAEHEEYYDLFLQAAGEIHSSYLDQFFEKCAEEYLAENFDTSNPF